MIRFLDRPTRRVKGKSKRLIHRALPSRFDAIVVASMGRAGSTVAFDALCAGMARARFGVNNNWTRRLVAGHAWEPALTTYAPGVVYKTHALGDELPYAKNVRVVYLFGSATDSALSVLACRDKYGDAWIEEHFQHLRARGDISELGSSDVLRFSDQLKTWTQDCRLPRLMIRYDELWEHVDTLSEFVGFPVKLPVKRQRAGAASISRDLRVRFAENYREIDAYIATLPSCQIRDVD